MSHWMALLPGPLPSLEAPSAHACVDACAESETTAPDSPLDARHLAWWCLQFTPRVALLEGAVVLELQASERLFGGTEVLRERIASEALALGVQAWAHAATALAALALARHALAQPSAVKPDAAKGCAAAETRQTTRANTALHLSAHDLALQALPAQLAGLPLDVLPGVAEHAHTLQRLGCRTLGQVRALPRGGLSRRFGAGLLRTLDQAHGLLPTAFEWVTLPPVFEARLELPGRVESAPALLFAAQRLLQQLCAWLAGQQAGITAFTLRWSYDWQRRDASREGLHTVRLSNPSREPQRLGRLLAEHLQRIQLTAPVGDIALHADAIEPLPMSSLGLFQSQGEEHLSAEPDGLITPAAQRAQRDALLALLDRLSVRLGPEHVLQGALHADHRLEWAQRWHPAAQQLAAKATPLADLAHPNIPQPCWVLPKPLPLALAHEAAGPAERPVYQGTLALLAGPHRVEAGWWDNTPGQEAVARDYYLASSEHAGLLWVFKARHATATPPGPVWFLHGVFA
jgi:protein ImuB